MIELMTQCERTSQIGNCARWCDACPIYQEIEDIEEKVGKAYEEAVEAIERILGGTDEVQGGTWGEQYVWEIGDIELRISIARKEE